MNLHRPVVVRSRWLGWVGVCGLVVLALAACGGRDPLFGGGDVRTVPDSSGTFQVGCPDGWFLLDGQDEGMYIVPSLQDPFGGVVIGLEPFDEQSDPRMRALKVVGDVDDVLDGVTDVLEVQERERRTGQWNGMAAGWITGRVDDGYAPEIDAEIYFATVRAEAGWMGILIERPGGAFAQEFDQVLAGFRPLSDHPRAYPGLAEERVISCSTGQPVAHPSPTQEVEEPIVHFKDSVSDVTISEFWSEHLMKPPVPGREGQDLLAGIDAISGDYSNNALVIEIDPLATDVQVSELLSILNGSPLVERVDVRTRSA